MKVSHGVAYCLESASSSHTSHIVPILLCRYRIYLSIYGEIPDVLGRRYSDILSFPFFWMAFTSAYLTSQKKLSPSPVGCLLANQLSNHALLPLLGYQNLYHGRIKTMPTSSNVPFSVGRNVECFRGSMTKWPFIGFIFCILVYKSQNQTAVATKINEGKST